MVCREVGISVQKGDLPTSEMVVTPDGYEFKDSLMILTPELDIPKDDDNQDITKRSMAVKSSCSSDFNFTNPSKRNRFNQKNKFKFTGHPYATTQNRA